MSEPVAEPFSEQPDERAPAPGVVDLLTPAPAALVGGKAAPLARAAAAGHPVPAGFVVTTADDVDEQALERHLAALGDGPFAVRSSAVGEDGIARSFAGQLETMLGVAKGDVLGAVRRCRASALALRALRYGRGVGPVAVIVQRLVPADVAGVAFSADPRTGERDVVIVEAIRGLGDRLVSGAVSPEAWRIDGERCERTRAGEGPALDEARARRVAALARALEALFGRPQDIEWAFSGGELWLLQSRPITALPAPPAAIPVEVPDGRWERDDHNHVPSPLGWALFQPYPRAMGETLRGFGLPIERLEARRIGGQVYLRFVMQGGDRPPPPDWLLWLFSRLAPEMRACDRRARALLDGETYMTLLDTWKREWKPDLRRRLAELDVEDPSTLEDDALLGRIDAAIALYARGAARHAQLHGPGILSLGKLALFAEDHLGWPAAHAFSLVRGRSHATTAAQRHLAALVHAHDDELRRLGRAPATWTELLSECPRLGQALSEWLDENRLRMLHYDPKYETYGERPDLVLSVVDACLAERARRRGASEEAAIGGAGADSSTNSCAGSSTDSNSDSDADSNTDSNSSAHPSALLDDARRRLTARRFAELERLVSRAREAYGLRDENGVDTISKPTGLVRRLVLELGRRLELERPDHAVYLEPSEHRAALRGALGELRARIEQRRREESWALQRRGPRAYGAAPPAPPVHLLPDGLSRIVRIMEWYERVEKPPEVAPEGPRLSGIGVGRRVIEGRARVLDGPEDMGSLQAGEIMVCRITSPEWSLGLGRVGAIVTDEGGQLSHPAIIAREHDVPAVLGTELATRRLRTGDILRVDPIASTVDVLRAAPRSVP